MTEVSIASSERILDTYWPVIEKAIEVQKYYAGKVNGTPRVCSDPVGALINELIEARKACPVKRILVEEENGNHSK